jgi:DegV family protein with EDD domain
MHRVCILTDTSVQFTRLSFSGDKLVEYIPAPQSEGLPQKDNGGMNEKKILPGLLLPSNTDIQKLFSKLRQDYSEILVITHSSGLSEMFSLMEKAAEQFGDQDKIQIIDSQTTSVGLGLLVQIAAKHASSGASMQEVEEQLRNFIPHVYTLLCLPNLSYLAAADFLSPAQAVIGEMLELLPIFSLEDGCLAVKQKVRTHRHLLETFQEFVDEFDDLKYVAIIKNGNRLRTQTFRDYLGINFPTTIYGEHSLGDSLTGLLGPQSVGLIVYE